MLCALAIGGVAQRPVSVKGRKKDICSARIDLFFLSIHVDKYVKGEDDRQL